MKQLKVTHLILWLWVFSVTFLMGGSVFEHVVLTPLWAGSPPDSVRAWQYGTVQAKFFVVVSSFYYLVALAMMIASWWMPSRVRWWALLAGLTAVVVGIATFGFFIPILQKTQATGGAGLSSDEITTLANQFTTWNWARWLAIIAGWAAGLRALALARSEPSDRR